MTKDLKLTSAFCGVLALLVLCALLAGCVTDGTNGTPAPIPTGCENALCYKIKGFMPNGPMVCRVGVSTGLAIASTAGHPEVRGIVALCMPLLYKATLNNSLANAMLEVKEKFATGKVGEYATPILVLFDSLNQAGIVRGKPVELTQCDKDVIASLFYNIGLDAGADPALFK